MIPSIFGYLASSAAVTFWAVAGSQFVTAKPVFPVISLMPGYYLNTFTMFASASMPTGLPAGPPR